MAYQDEHGERRRIVVETTNERREVVHSEQVRHPQSSGVSGATLAAVVIAVIALAAVMILFVFFFQAEDGIRDLIVTGVQTCALPISLAATGVIAPFPLVEEGNSEIQRR